MVDTDRNIKDQSCSIVSEEFPIWKESREILIPVRKIPISRWSSKEAQLHLHTAYTFYQNQFGTSSDNRSSAQKYLELQSNIHKAVDVKNEYVESQYEPVVRTETIAGVEVDIVHPKGGIPEKNRNRVVIHWCGGVNYLGSKLVHVAIQLSHLMRVEVVVPHYKAVPRFTKEEQDNDIRSIYKHFLLTRGKGRIAVFGESSGALITVRLVQIALEEGMAVPGALGLIGFGDVQGDSGYLFGFLDPMSIHLNVIGASSSLSSEKNGKQQSMLDAIGANSDFSDLEKFPPTTLVTGTRDVSLGSTVNIHRQLSKAGVIADLNIYEGMTHAHHTISHLPEAKEALKELAEFFDREMAN